MPTSAAYLAQGGYPENWKEIARYRREVMAGNQCEWVEADGSRCPRTHGEPIAGNETGRTILTVAHLDHNPTHNDLDNLRAWCQRHHLRYDAPLHAEHAARTRREKNARMARLLYGSEEPLFASLPGWSTEQTSP